MMDPDLAWATYLLASWWGGELPAPADSTDPAAVVDRLRRNGVPLLTLAGDVRPAAAALLASEPFRAALELDRARMAGQQATFAEIAAAWRGAGIPALYVKALGPQPVFPYVSNNLDVLVPQAQQDRARKIVRDMGYVELRHIEEPNKFLLRRYHLGESAFDIHIHGRLEWHTEFVDSPAAFRAARPRDDDPALYPSAADGVLIALAHAVYENKALKLIELAKVIYAARVLHVDWNAVMAGANRRGWLPGLWFALTLCAGWEEQLYGTASLPADVRGAAAEGTPAWLRDTVAARVTGPARAPLALPFLQSKRLFYGKMLADPSVSTAVRAREIYTHTLYGTRVRLRLRSQRPLLIALDGIDGCGKSAQAELLARALTGAALRHRVVWTRGGSSTFMQPLLRMGKRLLRRGQAGGSVAGGSTDMAARERARAGIFVHPLVRRVWPWLVALELGTAYFVRVRWPLWRGEVVVAERYVLTALIEAAARLDNPAIAASVPGRLLRLLAPRPGAAYWLDLPPAVALARKGGDESVEFLAAQAAHAPALAAERRSRRIDATLPLDVVSDRIVTETLRAYEDAHRTVLNALFCANPRPLPADWRASTANSAEDEHGPA